MSSIALLQCMCFYVGCVLFNHIVNEWVFFCEVGKLVHGCGYWLDTVLYCIDLFTIVLYIGRFSLDMLA